MDGLLQYFTSCNANITRTLKKRRRGGLRFDELGIFGGRGARLLDVFEWLEYMRNPSATSNVFREKGRSKHLCQLVYTISGESLRAGFKYLISRFSHLGIPWQHRSFCKKRRNQRFHVGFVWTSRIMSTVFVLKLWMRNWWWLIAGVCIWSWGFTGDCRSLELIVIQFGWGRIREIGGDRSIFGWLGDWSRIIFLQEIGVLSADCEDIGVDFVYCREIGVDSAFCGEIGLDSVDCGENRVDSADCGINWEGTFVDEAVSYDNLFVSSLYWLAYFTIEMQFCRFMDISLFDIDALFDFIVDFIGIFFWLVR